MANYGGIKGDHVSLTQEQKLFVKSNTHLLNDGQISRKLKVSRHIISYYRKSVLRIIKQRTSRQIKFDGTMITMSQVNEEIEALQNCANYPSLMNGAHYRMKYLMSIKEGKRITN